MHTLIQYHTKKKDCEHHHALPLPQTLLDDFNVSHLGLDREYFLSFANEFFKELSLYQFSIVSVNERESKFASAQWCQTLASHKCIPNWTVCQKVSKPKWKFIAFLWVGSYFFIMLSECIFISVCGLKFLCVFSAF